MLSVDDLVIIPYTSDLTQAGIAFACQTLPGETQHNRSEIFRRLRRLVIQQAAELAFRRHLSKSNVPHNLATSKSFSDPSRACAVIGGRCCDVYGYEIFHKGEIHQLHRDPQRLLTISTPVPSTDLSSQQRSDSDLIIVTFVTGLITPNLRETQKAASAGRPLFLIYPLPAVWSRRSSWSDLGYLTCKSESNRPLALTLVGQSEDRSFQTEGLNLPTLCKLKTHSLFYSLTYLQLDEIPSGRLGVYSQKLRKTLIIIPFEWGNIWVYGMQIYLAGWITRGEFKKNARPYPSDRSGWQPVSSIDKQLAMPVAELHPLEELFSKAIDWGNR
jgi:hypothetical protein